MLTDEETKALVLNRVRRSRETWEETKGIIEGGYWYAAETFLDVLENLIRKDGFLA